MGVKTEQFLVQTLLLSNQNNFHVVKKYLAYLVFFTIFYGYSAKISAARQKSFVGHPRVPACLSLSRKPPGGPAWRIFPARA